MGEGEEQFGICQNVDLVEFHVAVGPNRKDDSFCPNIMFIVWVSQKRNIFPKTHLNREPQFLGTQFLITLSLVHLNIIYPLKK